MRKGNSALLIIIIVLVVAAAGFFFLRGSQAPVSSPVATLETSSTSDDQTESRYVKYTKEGYELIKNTRHVLFFYANWCPVCRPADAEFQARSNEIPEDLKVV